MLLLLVMMMLVMGAVAEQVIGGGECGFAALIAHLRAAQRYARVHLDYDVNAPATKEHNAHDERYFNAHSAHLGVFDWRCFCAGAIISCMLLVQLT